MSPYREPARRRRLIRFSAPAADVGDREQGRDVGESREIARRVARFTRSRFATFVAWLLDIDG